MKKTLLMLPIFGIILLGCAKCSAKKERDSSAKEHVNIPIREYSVQSVLWQQLSGEYQALTYQAFNLAKFRLDEILQKNNQSKKPLAIITDIDETVLDNSSFNAKMIKLDEDYTKQRWFEWGNKKEALPIPGALDFFLYAQEKGIEVFYISNRYTSQKNETFENLKEIGFPYLDNNHILLKDSTSGKQPRRNKVLETYRVIMLIGDNLSDFSKVFDNKSTEERNYFVDSLSHDFGGKYIILPNPMYGDWETKGLYERDYNWTSIQKDSIRKAKLKTY